MAKTKKLLSTMMGMVLIGSLASTVCYNSVTTNASVIPEDGKYYTDYTTYDEAHEAAKEIGYEIAAEGDVLLKNNNNALPLDKAARVSVFGVSQDSTAGGSSSDVMLTDALETEGFRVNGQLSTYYKSIDTVFGSEVTDFNKSIERSMSAYNDAAIVIISREGGEGIYADNATVTEEEENDAEENVGGWTHAALHREEDGSKTYKHFMQFTDSEQALLNYVKAQGFKKIVYVINSTVPIEIYNIANDDAVDSIIWVGRPGEVGMTALAKIISGEVNPSGKTADTWYTDFTADPTWYNFGDNMQSNSTYYDGAKGSGAQFSQFWTMSNSYKTASGEPTDYFGVDYEEDIYLGYRYYETKAADMNAADPEGVAGSVWYKQAVTYPFGYGLSYTSFQYSNLSVVLDNGTPMSGTLSSGLFESYQGHEAAVKTATAIVTVKNTGSVAGKEAVEVYSYAPYYTGEIEKASEVLVGYAKTDILQPGQSQTVEVEFNIQDMASYDYTDANHNGNKGYELDKGQYTIAVAGNAHSWAAPDSEDYKAQSFILSDTANLGLDDYSGNEVSNLFSAENGMFYSLRDNSSASKYNFNASTSAGEQLMTRGDSFTDSFPVSPTLDDMVMSDSMLTTFAYWNNFTVDDAEYYDGKVIEGSVDEEDYPWLADVAAAEERMSGWTQNPSYDANAVYQYKMSDMTGIDPNDTVNVIASGPFAGKTGQEAWDEFMNMFSYYELQQLVANWQQVGLDTIGMNPVVGSDSSHNYASTFDFPDNTVLAATWNAELAEREGRVIGNMALLMGNNTWWGGATQIHRSYFAGRVHEYMSEDPMLAGTAGSSQIRGAESVGMICYVKHCVLNDQETNRAGYNPSAWLSEQCLREMYLKPFQMCLQEGEGQCVMGAYARIGIVCINNNYNLITLLMRGQWGLQNLAFASDNYIMMTGCVPLDLAVRAGSDNFQPGSLSGTWDAATGSVVTTGHNDATTNTIQYYEVREAAKRFLYLHANSAVNQNGVDLSVWNVNDLTLAQGVLANSDIGAGDVGADSVKYTLVKGTLPAGLTLNEDGTFSGTPTEAGTYTVTVQLAADNWITSNKTFTLVVDSAFALDVVEGGKAGEEYYATISSDTVKVTNPSTQSISYAIASGSLPDGLTLNAETGEIEGVPTVSGDYDITVEVSYTVTSGSGFRVTKTTSVYTYNTTISVESGAAAGIQPSFRTENGMIQYNNGDGTWVDVIEVSQLQGETGADGVGIVNISKGSTDGNVDTYVITMSDGNSYTVTVTNGVDGADGAVGGASADLSDYLNVKNVIIVGSVAAIVVIVIVAVICLVRPRKED